MGFTRWQQTAPDSRQVWHQSFEQNKFDMGLGAPAPGDFMTAVVRWSDISGDKMSQAANEDAWTPVLAVARS